VTNARGVFDDAIAEWVIAATLAMVSGLHHAIVSQQALEVRDGENWHSLTQRLHQLEMQLLPVAVRTLVEGRGVRPRYDE